MELLEKKKALEGQLAEAQAAITAASKATLLIQGQLMLIEELLEAPEKVEKAK